MPTPAAASPPADLHRRLRELMLVDERRLRRRLDGAGRVRDPLARQGVLDAIAADVEAAAQRVARRRATVPTVGYPPELPITGKVAEIRAALREHQVVVVAGETGSGKTTQLPKICLELGRGVRGMVGHTQPRRIAARTVAERIAEELGVPLGGPVGYAVRFTDRAGDDTLVKLMTDGILLAEVQHDRQLLRYDTLIIDEAHERSLNIDFILGYVKQLLPRRPELKVVITSATIDPHRFAGYFGGAPVVEVSGRTYPVQVRYRPIEPVSAAGPAAGGAGRAGGGGAQSGAAVPSGAGGARDQADAICDAVGELAREEPGDVLVFLSGEREIRDTADALRRRVPGDTEILPLYARLSAAEQHRVFAPHTGRRVVLATNVAETSLTVPGIRYVVDPGTARISRYSARTKVQRLPIEPVSQASANQRKGRCGRLSDGICIRLYSQADFDSRAEFTEPEILRTSLASVILQMTALGLGDVAAFPFLDPPDRRSVAAGVQLLEELGAFEPARPDGAARRLTPLGRRLAQLPIDPRLARMVLEADRNGCAREVMVIAAALSIQDPRERPVDRQQAADQLHARFADPGSDFLAYLNLWRYLHERLKELSSSQFRRMCLTEHLNYLRVREWQDLYGQLRQVSRTLGITLPGGALEPPDAGRAQRIHQSLLAGLLSQIGVKDVDGPEYLGARGARFAVFPGSALFRKPPRWAMAGELVETSRLWARVVARIEPEWAEALAGHLVKRSYSEPRWDAGRGAVLATERVTLYGVPLVTGRTVNYGGIDPVLSRELFIRHALVEGDWTTRHAFFHRNRELLAEVEELEHRVRRRDIVVDDQALFDFYDKRLPAEVVSARHFDAWWKKAGAGQPELLTFDRAMLVSAAAGAVSEADYPGHWVHDGLRLGLVYTFEPGSEADGVTVVIPLAVLNQVDADAFGWQVPGLRHELVTALIRSLPKALRRNFVPAPDVAAAVLARATPYREPLLDAVERELYELTRVAVPREAWQPDRVPPHLLMTYRVVDERDRTVAEGKDLAALRQRLTGQLRAQLSAAAPGVAREGARAWEFGTLPRTVEQRRGGFVVKAYPALVDEGDAVAVRVLETEAEQRRAMWLGTRRLLLLGVPSPARVVNARLSNEAKLALSRNPHRSAADLIDDCVACAVDRLLADHGGPVWDAEAFARLRDRVAAELPATVLGVVADVQAVLGAAYQLRQRLAAVGGAPLYAEALADVRAQLDGLVYRGFVAATGWQRLPDLVRYLRAAQRRLDKLPDNPRRDRELTAEVHEVEQAYRETVAEAARDGTVTPALHEARWMIEELRVSYFAQALGTPYPVSTKRIYRALDQR